MSQRILADGRPDVEGILSRLKKFQRRSAEYAFERLYLAPDSTRRFLLADEVGLGKTLVAKGIIAKAIEHLWDDVDRIDIVYICSNSQIATQNVNRLRVTREEFVQADRLTLLPSRISDLKANWVNYLAFTPGTSFDLRSSLGRRGERVLLYWLMQGVWERDDTGPKNLFQGQVASAKKFRTKLKKFRDEEEIDRALARAFKRKLLAVGKSKGWGGEGLRKTYHELCDRFGYARKRIPEEDKRDRNVLIGRLRSLLASTCVDALEPDLVILDEFQRFKEILDGDDEPSLLAQQLFNYTDAKSKARLLLLSATPYKMYTLHHESQDDDHYQDFLRTVEFLDPQAKSAGSFEKSLQGYRRELYRLGNGGSSVALEEHTSDIESGLRRVMCRTERARGDDDGDQMLREVRAEDIALEKADVVSFSHLQQIADVVAQPRVIEYWKSAPYLLNFMDDYRLKQAVRDRIDRADPGSELEAAMRGADGVLLPWETVRSYEAVDPANARLRQLFDWLERMAAWKMLWMPPTLPYYLPDRVFRRAAAAGFSKRLVFSTWNVVPKTVASLLSYEVERRILPEFDPDARNTSEARKQRKGLLTFSESKGRLTGMPLLGILYPSPALAEIGDPLRLARDVERREDEGASSSSVLKLAKKRVAEALRPLTARAPQNGVEDESWYWAAPILLDLATNPDATRSWFARKSLNTDWQGDAEAQEESSRWTDHVERAGALVRGAPELGRPPRDLANVLAAIAVGGPAVCALRAFGRAHGGGDFYWTCEARDAAGQSAWGFRSLFNQPESMALLRAGRLAGEKPYWQLVLDYCVGGCLQSVLDEYIRVLTDLEGLADVSAKESVGRLGKAMTAALALRAGTPGIDNVRVDEDRRGIAIEGKRMRNHFAVRFGVQESDDGRGARVDQVRTAFNSPFWPFVLTTTSVGQGGLDFHAYCHAVVHWNLPSNPVDLEQREGRVHRYKGHAIRKNVAMKVGEEAVRAQGCDVWQDAFELACRHVDDTGLGMNPYWCFRVEGGAAVERHVLALPLSRDIKRMEALRRSLAVYRMVFGQPRQEDLTAYLMERLSEDELRALKPLLRIDLSPRCE